jgi:hypothetical protein
MEPMTDELKEVIIRKHPDGIWLVLAEEYPPGFHCEVCLQNINARFA